MIRVCVVCLGNICRSPLGEGVLRSEGMKSGLRMKVESAGTANHHVGESPDPRSIAAARRHGLDISGQRAAQFLRGDFQRFDWVLAMDTRNRDELLRLAASEEDANKVQLFLPHGGDVPDPYYGETSDFEYVFELVSKAAAHWIQTFRER